MNKWERYGRPSVKFIGGLLLLWFLCLWEPEWLLPLLLAWFCHESAHLACARALGWSLGLGMRLRCPCLWQEALIVAAGPLGNFLLCCLLPGRWGVAQLVLGIANSLPALPLDGGRLLRLLLIRWFSWFSVSRLLCIWGGILGFAFCLAGGGWFGIGFLLLCLALEENQRCRQE